MADFTIPEYQSLIGSIIAETDRIQHEQMERACRVVEGESKSAIGTNRYGWAPLAESTVRKKGHDRPLEETDELRSSIEHDVAQRGLYKVTGEVGSNLDRAVFNELGTSRAPPRSFLAEAARQREAEVVHILGAASLRGLTGRGTL